MKTIVCNWIDLGNLMLGLGTFTLAVVLGIINLMGSRKNRKIHIADKRQEWLTSFRKQISEVLTLQQQYNLIAGDCSVEELDLLLKELNMASNQIRFMFDPSNSNRDKLEELFSEIMTDFRNKRTENFTSKQYKIIQISDSILKEQRMKIANLDNSDPLI